MLGDNILVCPVLSENTVTRDAVLPHGTWEYVDGTRYVGGTTITVSAPIDVLPYFRKCE